MLLQANYTTMQLHIQDDAAAGLPVQTHTHMLARYECIHICIHSWHTYVRLPLKAYTDLSHAQGAAPPPPASRGYHGSLPGPHLVHFLLPCHGNKGKALAAPREAVPVEPDLHDAPVATKHVIQVLPGRHQQQQTARHTAAQSSQSLLDPHTS